MKYLMILVYVLIWLPTESFRKQPPETWRLFLIQEGKEDTEVALVPETVDKWILIRKKVGNISVSLELKPENNSIVFNASAITDSGSAMVYFAMTKKYTNQVACNFNGPVDHSEAYRQSPHDVNAWIVTDIAMQALPVVVLKDSNQYEVTLCGSPAYYDNFTSQVFDNRRKTISLCSGDNAATPGLHPASIAAKPSNYNTEKNQVMSPGRIISGYHTINREKSHVFEGIIFTCTANSWQGLRRQMNERAASHFSGGKFNDYFGALSFITAYMNLRKNETGRSQYWVVPSVEYANTQYGRDAFWISTMLPEKMSAECLKNELDSVNHYAEYALLTVLWSYRTWKDHQPVDLKKVQAYVDAIEKHARGGYFYSYDEEDGRQDFQYWGDVIAFDRDDVITYNQGLFALTLAAAREMGMKLITNPETAVRLYQNLYQPEGYYPISKKKNKLVGPDPVLPDLLSKLYMNHFMLPDDRVKKHFDLLVTKLKTAYGFKVIARNDGSYLHPDDYNVPGYISQANRDQFPDGQYFKGGSFFLYDAMFLMDAYLHGIAGSEDLLIWRTSLDFRIGGTTFECLNTKTGEAWKPNMGWNVAVYAFWKQLIDQGKAGDRLLTITNQH